MDVRKGIQNLKWSVTLDVGWLKASDWWHTRSVPAGLNLAEQKKGNLVSVLAVI